MAYSRYAHDDNGRYDTLANGIFAHSDRGPAAQLVADQVELVVERLQPNRVGVRTGGNAGQIVFDTSLFAAQLGDVPHSLEDLDLGDIIPACVARALHPAVRADGTHILYARSFITCDGIHFRTIFFSPGDRSPMGRGKDGVIYCMDSLGGAAGWGSTANNAVLVRLRELAATHNWAVQVSRPTKSFQSPCACRVISCTARTTPCLLLTHRPALSPRSQVTDVLLQSDPQLTTQVSCGVWCIWKLCQFEEWLRSHSSHTIFMDYFAEQCRVHHLHHDAGGCPQACMCSGLTAQERLHAPHGCCCASVGDGGDAQCACCQPNHPLLTCPGERARDARLCIHSSQAFERQLRIEYRALVTVLHCRDVNECPLGNVLYHTPPTPPNNTGRRKSMQETPAVLKLLAAAAKPESSKSSKAVISLFSIGAPSKGVCASNPPAS